MAYLLISENGKIKKFVITEDFVFIGRTPENQIRISDPNASRQHCQIIRVDGGLRLIDLGSQFGTLVGGQPVKQKDLAEKDVIQIGEVKIQVRDVASGAAPAAKPAAAPKPAVQKPSAAAARPASRRAGSRRKPEIKASPEVARAAAVGGRLVRKNPRKAAKIPTWAMLLIVVSIFVIVAVIIGYVVKSTGSSHGNTYRDALTMMENRKYDEAIALFQKIPESDPVYGEKSREKINEANTMRGAGAEQRDVKNASRQYHNNIIQYIETFIDAPAGDEKKILLIKRKYGPDRPSYIRVLLVDRLEPFMKRFKGSTYMKHVKELYAKYCKEVNPRAPASYRDVEVQAQAWLRLKYYGKAYQAMAQWIAANPGSGRQADASQFYGRIWDLTQSDWVFEEPFIAKNEKDDNPTYALDKINRFLGLLEGYDRPEANSLRSKLEERKADNEARARTIEGVKR